MQAGTEKRAELSSSNIRHIPQEIAAYQVQLWDQVSDAVFFINTQFSIQYCNRTAEEAFGWQTGQVAGKNIWDTLRPEPVHTSLRKALKQLFKEGSWQGEAVAYHQNNTRLYLRVSLQLVENEEGEVAGAMAICQDLTLQKTTQLEMLRSQARFKALAENTSDLIAIVRADGTQVYASPAVELLLHLEQVKEKNIFERVHPEDLPRVLSEFSKALKEPDLPVSTELRYLNGHNQYIYLACIATNRINDKNIEGVIINARDITESKRIEETLRKSEVRFKALVSQSPDVIGLLSANGTRTYVSPTSEKVLGRKAEELTGNYATDFIHPEDTEIARRFLIQILKNPDVPHSFEFRFRHMDGHYLWVECTAINRLNDPDIEGIVFNCWDITQRKHDEEKIRRSEEQLQTLMTYTSDFISIIRADGTRSYISPSAEKILGVPAESLLEISIYRHMHPDDIEHTKQVFSHVLTHPEEPIHLETRFVHPLTQEWVYLETLGNNLFAIPGINGFMVTTRDITPKRKTENELKQVLEELRKRNYELDNFVYKVSHDLRAPLCSILGLTELIKIEEDKPAVIQEYNDLIASSVHRLDTYIRTVLNYSQIINIKDKIQPIDFQQIINECLQELRYLANFSRLRTEVSIQAQDDTFFCNDELKITTIFKNFLSNAIKYLNPEVSPNWLRITVEITRQDALIIIADNGSGIDDMYQDKIFEMFFRGNEKADGSGLGLYIVKQIIEKSGGSLSLQSKLGEGTAFALRLPNNCT